MKNVSVASIIHLFWHFLHHKTNCHVPFCRCFKNKSIILRKFASTEKPTFPYTVVWGRRQAFRYIGKMKFRDVIGQEEAKRQLL